MNRSVRYYAASLTGIACVCAVYGLTRYPALSPSECEQLAARFKFVRQPLPEVARHPPYKKVRQVHPSLERIAAWISTLGAAVTLVDLDGDGLPNDICYVDPRTDLITVAPAPGTGSRYQPFALNHSPLPYDPSTVAPMGTIAGDFNEDGLLDIMAYYWGRTPVLFLRRSRDAALTAESYLPRELTTSGERWFSNGATQADLDGDGHVDIFIGNYFQDGAEILNVRSTAIQSMHDSKSKAANGGKDHIFLWQSASGGAEPAANFNEISDALTEEVSRAWTLAVGAVDLDGDMLPEIYLGDDFGPDFLLHNRSSPGRLEFAVLRGKRDWTTPKSCVIGADSFKGMGVDFGDVNGDGILDIYVSNIATKFGLTESHFLWLSTGDTKPMKEGIAPYIHGSEKLGLSRSGWGWEARLADFDNDGVLEAIQACGFLKGTINRWTELQALGTSNDQIVHNPRFWPNFKPGADLSGHDYNPFFVRAADGRYYDIAPQLGLSEPMVSKGIATADVDGDGRLDFVTANQWEQSFFFHNEAPTSNAFLGLHLLLPINSSAGLTTTAGHPSSQVSARPAIGAVAKVQLPDGRKLISFVDGGTGHSGKRSADIHFGLGHVNISAKLNVDLRWRDTQGRIQNTTLSLPPGWHTVLLGTPAPQQARVSDRSRITHHSSLVTHHSSATIAQ